MTAIIHKVTSLKHGAFVRVKYRTDVQPSAKFKSHKIEKIVETTVRVGVSYSNLSAVKERRATETKPTGPSHVQWWRWCEGYQNIMKEKISDPSQKYVTLATVPKGGNTMVFWYIDGKPVSEEEVRVITIPSYWNKPNLDVFDVKLENLISVGK